jgi:hypothetical protein
MNFEKNYYDELPSEIKGLILQYAINKELVRDYRIHTIPKTSLVRVLNKLELKILNNSPFKDDYGVLWRYRWCR